MKRMKKLSFGFVGSILSKSRNRPLYTPKPPQHVEESPLIQTPYKWMKRRRYLELDDNLRSNPRYSDSAINNNPFARVLASPLRSDVSDRVLTPRRGLQDFYLQRTTVDEYLFKPTLGDSPTHRSYVFKNYRFLSRVFSDSKDGWKSLVPPVKKNPHLFQNTKVEECIPEKILHHYTNKLSNSWRQLESALKDHPDILRSYPTIQNLLEDEFCDVDGAILVLDSASNLEFAPKNGFKIPQFCLGAILSRNPEILAQLPSESPYLYLKNGPISTPFIENLVEFMDFNE